MVVDFKLPVTLVLLGAEVVELVLIRVFGVEVATVDVEVIGIAEVFGVEVVGIVSEFIRNA